MKPQALGVPEGMTRVWPQPDTLPVEFTQAKCCYAYWITEELMRELEDE